MLMVSVTIILVVNTSYSIDVSFKNAERTGPFAGTGDSTSPAELNFQIGNVCAVPKRSKS